MEETLHPQVLGASIGALITAMVGIAAFWFTNYGHNKRQQIQHQHEHRISREKFLKEKIEDIYLSFSNWDRNFSSCYLGMIGYVKGEMHETDALEFINRNGNIRYGEYLDKVEMLLTLYFPHLLEEFKGVMEQRSQITKFFPIGKSSQTGNISSFYATQENYENQVEKFKKALQAEIESLL